MLRQVQYIYQNPYASLNPRKTVSQIVSGPVEHFTGKRGAETTASSARPWSR